MPTPPPPASGADILAFTITNLDVDGNNDVSIAIDALSDKSLANDITITNASTTPIDYLRVEKFGDNDGESDVIRIDLSEFDDDFTLDIRNTGNTVEDFVYLEGVHEFTDNGDGTFTATYYGTDSNLHSVLILPEDATVTPYFAPDGIVTGKSGGELMGDGYADVQGDEIGAGDGNDDDVIIGGRGSDSIYAGVGNDSISGDFDGLTGNVDTELPPNVFAGSPGGPAAGAEIDTFTIDDAAISGGVVTVEVDSFADKTLINDVTIAHGGSTPITQIDVKKFGDGDDQPDVIRFDLSTYDDDFLVTLANEDAVDTVVFENVHEVTDNGDGTWSVTYFGSDSNLHSVSVDPDTADVAFYAAPKSVYFFDDYIDAGDGADTVDGGFGDDEIYGGLGDDALDGGDGSDTIDGGDGNDTIQGDREFELQPLSDTMQYSYAQDINGDQASHFGELGTGTANDPNLLFDGDENTEARWHQDDIIEYDFGQEVPAGTSLSLIEGSNGTEDEWVDVYVSFGTTDPNGDALSGSGGGVGYENAVTNGDSVLIYSGPSDATVDLVLPINATHLQIVTVASHSGFAEIELTEVINPLAPGDDVITGGDGNDVILAGAGDDTIDGGADNDSIDAGLGNDSVLGGDGADTLDGGEGYDRLTGGDGSDVFLLSDGHDTISDFNFGNSGPLGDGDNANNDYVDLSGHYDSLGELKADQADDGVLNQSNTLDDKGNSVDYSDNTQFGSGSLTMEGATAESYTNDNTGVVCFTSGTLIDAPGGARPIDDLQVGDLVTTMDNGAQRIVWIGHRHIGYEELRRNERLRPVLIKQGVLGVQRDLLVSRQHGMLLGQDNLARAVHLAETTPGVRIAHGKRWVTYTHLMFEAHQILFAEGAPSESFYPGPMSTKMLDRAALRELVEVFPGFDAACQDHNPVQRWYGTQARTFLKKKDILPRLVA